MNPAPAGWENKRAGRITAGLREGGTQLLLASPIKNGRLSYVLAAYMYVWGRVSVRFLRLFRKGGGGYMLFFIYFFFLR